MSYFVACQVSNPHTLERRVEYLLSLVYPDLRRDKTEPSGGYVEMHVTQATSEAARNVETAVVLAKLGFKVLQLPIDNTPHVKNSDAYLINEDIVIEFKHNYVPTASAIEREVRNAKDQTDYVLIHVMSNISRDELILGLRLRIHRAENVVEVWLLIDNIP